MNLLLLLSALLSALTGAHAGVRRAEVPQAMEQRPAATQTAAAAAHAVAVRFAAASLRLVGALRASCFVVAPPPISTRPLWASRRRE